MATSDLTHEQQRKLAADLFNFAWTLIDKADRTAEEAETMINAAHASLFHWSRVGTGKNLAIGEWQVSRAYAVAGRPEPALHHAERAAGLARDHAPEPFFLAYGCEALARAHALAGDAAAFDRAVSEANAHAEKIDKAEDRELFLAEQKTQRRPPQAAR
jgi:hypothetical protein